jgi:hypothetical protein
VGSYPGGTRITFMEAYWKVGATPRNSNSFYCELVVSGVDVGNVPRRHALHRFTLLASFTPVSLRSHLHPQFAAPWFGMVRLGGCEGSVTARVFGGSPASPPAMMPLTAAPLRLLRAFRFSV